MRRSLFIGLAAAIAALAAATTIWAMTRHRDPRPTLVLHGNVDLRQVDLAFNNSERIAEVLVQEGDRVHRGQVLARLETRRLEPQLAQSEAEAAAQRAVVARMHNGSRPEEIAQARATVASADADAANAARLYGRLFDLSQAANRAVSQQDVDNAKAALDMARARLAVNQKALDLALLGPRHEDVAQAEAQSRSDEARAVLLRQQVADAELLAPTDAVVRTRLMEPGDMASPQRPVFSLAVTDPKWVRAYVSDAQLSHVHPGQRASIGVDSYPGRRFAGWVGFVSPIAEFTPKSVETEELRTSLVYEVRVFVSDSVDALRLGQPATVFLSSDSTGRAAPVNDRPRTAPVGP